MPAPQLPRFEVAARVRPVALVQPGTRISPAPYAAAETDLRGAAPGRVGLVADGLGLAATWDGDKVAIERTSSGATSRHLSRRHGRGRAPDALGLAVTGSLVSAFAREAGDWVLRARVDLEADGVPLPDAPLSPTDDAARHGRFGQLGLRDLRLVTHADGSAYLADGRPLLTATSAGPGGFRSAHTSVWSLDPDALSLTHRADLFFRRPGRRGVAAYGDHATHLVRDGERWLVTTSTWGDFDRDRYPHVGITVAHSDDDLLAGAHVLDTEPLAVPTTGLGSVGTWDPQLVRADDTWRLTFVSARRFFRFHPAIAEGTDLSSLRLRAAATDRVATEGVTQVRLDGRSLVLASDGRDGHRGQRAAYPVFDLDLRQVDRLDACYPSNIPWPTLVPHGDTHLLVGFDGSTHGGAMIGYGSHGSVVFQHFRSTPVSQ